MATQKLTSLEHLQKLAVKTKAEADAIRQELREVTVPTKVSELTNDAKYQTDTQVAAAIAAADHLKRKIVDSTSAINPATAGADQYIYMVPNTASETGNKYDEYMVINGAVERVGDWAVDLSGYVQKESGKGLSTNDYTAADKDKLDNLEFATDAEVDQMLAQVFGGTDG